MLGRNQPPYTYYVYASYFVGNPDGDTHVRGRDIGREKRGIEIGRGRGRIGIEIWAMKW